ncbi:hypothetical protein [Methanosalsum natronophilum]|nr:hypothetical protein [Methanosalsum natronophilum]MCS3924431.1 hypothetical protein [Methanosalsum natronophilum]
MDKKVTPSRSYRLPDRTLKLIDFLIENGAARNGTEAIIIAIERFAKDYQPGGNMDLIKGNIEQYLNSDDGKDVLEDVLTQILVEKQRRPHNPNSTQISDDRHGIRNRENSFNEPGKYDDNIEMIELLKKQLKAEREQECDYRHVSIKDDDQVVDNIKKELVKDSKTVKLPNKKPKVRYVYHQAGEVDPLDEYDDGGEVIEHIIHRFE